MFVDAVLAGDVEWCQVRQLSRLAQQVVDVEPHGLQRQQLLEGDVVRHVEVSQRRQLAEERRDGGAVGGAQPVHGERAQPVAAPAERGEAAHRGGGDVEPLQQRQVLDDLPQAEFVEVGVAHVEAVQPAQLGQRDDDAELAGAAARHRERGARHAERAQVDERPVAETADDVVDGQPPQPTGVQLQHAVLAQRAQPARRQRTAAGAQAHATQRRGAAREHRQRAVGEVAAAAHRLQQPLRQLDVEDGRRRQLEGCVGVGGRRRRVARRQHHRHHRRRGQAERRQVVADEVETRILQAARTLVHLNGSRSQDHHSTHSQQPSQACVILIVA